MSLAAARYAQLANSLSRPAANQLPQELSNLSHSDIELLDAVIQRASPTVTSFTAVFMAYKDVLTERGLDPHEVVYYGKLLKLGTLRGINWGEKWNYVKRHQSQTPQPSPPSESESDLLSPINHSTPRKAQTRQPVLTQRQQPPLVIPHVTQVYSGPEQNDYGNFSPTTSATPPSYRSVLPTPSLPRYDSKSERKPPKTHLPFVNPEKTSAAAARQVVAQARARRGSAIDEDAAWNKIRQARDEENADAFRDDKQLERCWNVWRNGWRWIQDTNEQISEARNKHIMREYLQRWRERKDHRVALHDRVTALSNTRLLRSALVTWKSRHSHRKQEVWRRDMRTKMALVRKRVDGQLRQNCWAIWRHAYRLRLADARYSENMAFKSIDQWRSRLHKVSSLVDKADDFYVQKSYRTREIVWRRWRRSLTLRENEIYLQRKKAITLLRRCTEMWKKRIMAYDIADSFYTQALMKRSMSKLNAAHSRVSSLEIRARKHIARQDDLLVRAVAHVWKARERGKLLERVRSARLMRHAVSVWKSRIEIYQELEDAASRFSSRPDSTVVLTTFRKWQQVTDLHMNAQADADNHFNEQLKLKYLVAWQAQLRQNDYRAKSARNLHRTMLKQRSFSIWHERLDAKRREKNLHEWMSSLRNRILQVWITKTRQQRQYRVAEEMAIFTDERRLMKHALTRWTNRMIDIKSREYDVVKLNEAAVLSVAFKRWKSICIRHVEEINLLESYQLVKDEEQTRRIFYRWLSLARAARHKRVTLQETEDEMRLIFLSNTWEKWRDRYADERLRDVKHAVIIQMQRNVLFRAFGIWKSKTNSLPAIRFHASHIKARAWNVWRATIPSALRAKAAREMDSQNTLSRFVNHWTQAYKKRIDLKAVARARYLRLPTTSPRRPVRPLSAFPKTSAHYDTDEDEEEAPTQNDTKKPASSYTRATPSPFIRAPQPKSSLTTLLNRTSAPKTIRSEASPTRDSIREPSPTRSSVYGRYTAAYSDRNRSPVRWSARPPSEPVAGMEKAAGSTFWPKPPQSESASVERVEPSKNRLWSELRDVRARGRSRTTTTRPF